MFLFWEPVSTHDGWMLVELMTLIGTIKDSWRLIKVATVLDFPERLTSKVVLLLRPV